MKKRLSINTLALGNLLKHKGQYTVLIFTIILAMIFSSSALMLTDCMNQSIIEQEKVTFGNFDILITGMNDKAISELKKADFVEDYGYAHSIAMGFTENSGKENGVSIAWLDEKAKELLYLNLIEGRYPEKENEIAIEQAVLDRLGINAKVGEEINLSLLTQNGDEYLTEPVSKKYILSGICNNRRRLYENVMGYQISVKIPAAYVSDNSKIELGGKEALTCFFNTNIPYTERYSIIDNFCTKNEIDTSYFSISEPKTSNFQFDFYDEKSQTILQTAIITVMLFFASSLGIINSFNANLKNRRTQIGMLRAVGATKRQIIRIFGREALYISLISMPISLIISYVLVKTITKLLGDYYLFIPNIRLIILCMIVSFICVMLAALIPLIRATQITPIQAIRNIDVSRKMKRKHIKTQKQFDVPKLLSKRTVSFYKSKQIISTLLIVIAIVISSLGMSYYDYQKNHLYSYTYDYQLSGNSVETLHSIPFTNIISAESDRYMESDKAQLYSSEYVEQVNGYKKCKTNMEVESLTEYQKASAYTLDLTADMVFDGRISYESQQNQQNVVFPKYSDDYVNTSNEYFDGKNFVPLDTLAIDESLFAQLDDCVVDGKIDISKINSGKEVIITAPTLNYVTDEYNQLRISSYNYDELEKNSEKVSKEINQNCYHAGDKIKIKTLYADNQNSSLTEYKTIEKEVTIGAVINTLPEAFTVSDWQISPGNTALITSLSGMTGIYPYSKFCDLEIKLGTECSDKIDEAVRTQIEYVINQHSSCWYTSNYEYQTMQKQENKTLAVTILSLIIILLSMITSIITNTITASVREDKKKIGTLRAVGASQKDIIIIYIREMISMLLWGYIIGFGIFIVSYFPIDISLGSKMFDKAGLDFNPWLTLISCLITFVICSLNLYSKIRREMKNSIVENIREL